MVTLRLTSLLLNQFLELENALRAVCPVKNTFVRSLLSSLGVASCWGRQEFEIASTVYLAGILSDWEQFISHLTLQYTLLRITHVSL